MSSISETIYKMKILSRSSSIDILFLTYYSPLSMIEISTALNIPYSTIKTRITELERAEMVATSNAINPRSGKKAKIVKAINFTININLQKIIESERP